LSFAVAAAAFLSAVSASAAPSQNSAVVRAVRGTANFSTDRGANWKKLSVGAKLKQDSVVRTAPGSNVDLYLGDNGPVVRVTEDTTMGIDALTSESIGGEKIIDTQLDLKAGRILGKVDKMAAASKYEVKTPQGVAGIRGTRYDIRADGTVTVIEGQVVVVYIVGGQASTATVNAGQTATPPVVAGGDVPIAEVPPGVMSDVDGQLDEAGRTVVIDPTTTVTVIVPDLKDTLNDGERADIETDTEGTPTPPTDGGGE